MGRYRKTNRWARAPKKERVPGTPRQEAWRKRLWAIYCRWCEREGLSPHVLGKEYLADKMGIEPYQAEIYDMDETEMITVAAIINGEFVELGEDPEDHKPEPSHDGYSKGGKDVDPNVPF